MQVQPYLFFDGRAEEAIEFYKKAVGAKVEMLMRNKENPEGKFAPGSEEKVMHSCMRIGETAVMASDGFNKGNPVFQGFSLTISAKDTAEAKRLFDALGEGGKVTTPLTKTFFSPSFGMLNDKFGVGWIILTSP